MSHALVERLTRDLGWPLLSDMEGFEEFSRGPGVRVAFVPGDPVRNLETADVAVILPELRKAFANRFLCAVTAASIEEAIREATGVFNTPSLIFFADGTQIGDIQKVRDWSDYVARVQHILSRPVAAA